MKTNELIKLIEENVSKAAHFKNNTLFQGMLTYLPMVVKEKEGNLAVFTTAYMQNIVTAEGDSYTSVLYYDGSEFHFVCGNDFLDGQLSKNEAKEMIQDVILATPSVAKFEPNMADNYGLYKKSSGCHFHPMWNGNKTLCEHVIDMLSEVSENDYITQLVSMYNEAVVQENKKDLVYSKMARYAFKKHLLLEGEKGSGKTFGAYQFLEEEGFKEDQIFFIGGHESLEAYHLLGQLVPYNRKVLVSNKTLFPDEKTIQELVWKDGALTAAFRKAAAGERAILFIDEMLRIPQRELNILVSALTPNNKGQYTLRTERIVSVTDSGVATEEVVKCPVGNLWVIGTTNTGAGYAVDTIDEALADRFRTIRQDTDRNKTKSILEAKASKKGFSLNIVQKVMEFYDRMISYKKKEELSKIINLRHLSEAIEFALDEGEVKEMLEDTMLTWVDRNSDGYPEEAQIELIQETLNKIFK